MLSTVLQRQGIHRKEAKEMAILGAYCLFKNSLKGFEKKCLSS